MPEGSVQPEAQNSLTEEQQQILLNIYQYEDVGELTEEDFATLRVMFDKPEKFALLRRALQILTPRERGLTMPAAFNFIEASPSDREKFAFEVAVDARSDEKQRQTLVALYRRVRQSITDTTKAAMEKQNQAEFEEKQRTEEYEEGQEAETRHVGDRI